MAKKKLRKARSEIPPAPEMVITIKEVSPPTKQSIQAIKDDPVMAELFFPKLSRAATVVGRETSADDFARINPRKR